MKLLTRSQIVGRVVVLGGLALALTAAIVAVEMRTDAVQETAVTAWTVFTAGLGGWALYSTARWRSGDHGAQSDWQPYLFLKALGAGFAFQAGVVGYFVGNDLVAAIVGSLSFSAVLILIIVAIADLEFADA